MEIGYRLLQVGIIIVFIVCYVAIFELQNTLNEISESRSKCVNYCHGEGLSYDIYDLASSECHCNGELNNKVVIIE